MKHGEASMQAAVIAICETTSKHKKILAKFLHHSPNGGKRNPAEAARFKAEGTKAGFPDLILPYGNGRHAGLACELKYGKNALSDNQKEWLEFFEGQGWFVFVGKNENNIAQIIEAYMDGRI